MADSQQTRYINQKKLGTGAMGEVWLATDTLLNRPVAIKYFKAQQDTSNQEAILAEARMLASLNHPHITSIYDAIYDEKKNSFCLVMEYVEGKSLADLIKSWSGPLPLEVTLDVGTGTLQALQYAHEHGVVHRDIKPANVMMHKEGVKLTDFGVAGLISRLAAGTEYMAGTPAYMSPEQIAGEATDGRADLYALGVMLFEMASGGRQPFQFSNLDEVLDAHLEQSPLPLREFAPDTPLALERTIMRLLAKNRADRYPSAEAVIDILHSIQARHKFSQSHLDLLDPEARPLIGRSEELKQMAAIWAESRESAKPHLLVMQGKTGMGKSKLATEFLGQHLVDQGYAALVGRCDESGAPYAPFADVLATIIDKKLTRSAISQEQTDRLLGQIPGLARLLNVSPSSETEPDDSAEKSAPGSSGLWQMLDARVSSTTPSNPAQIEWQFFATVLAILTDLGPIAILLENATILDDASAELAHFLIQQEQLPLLLMATCRDNDGTISWLDSFAAGEYHLITLSPFSESELNSHLTNLIGGAAPETVVDLIAERSQGVPLQIEEIVQHLLDSKQLRQDEAGGQWHYKPDKKIGTVTDAFLPKGVLSALTRQIEKLSKSSREALAIAALLEPGPEFNFNIWVTLLEGESPQQQAQEALGDALKKRILRKIGEHRYTFRPPDVAKALASTLTNTRRRELHRQIAKLLHRQQADPILVGHHYEQGGTTADAASYLERAGNKAIAANAFDTAIAYYQRAGQLAESRSAYKALGHLYRLKGEMSESVRAFERALPLAKKAGDIADQAQILNGLAQTLWLYDDYITAYTRAAAVLKLDGAPENEYTTAQAHLGMIAWLTGRLSEAEDWVQKSLDALRQSDNEIGIARAYTRLGRVHLSQGKPAEARTVFQHALELYQKLGANWGQAHCLNNLGRVATEQGDFEQAASHFESAQSLFEKTHTREGLMAVYTNRGRALLYQARPDETLPWLTKALPLALEQGKRNAYVLSDIYLLIAQTSLAQSKVDQAQAAADDALKLVETAGNQEYIAQAQATLALTYAAQGNSAAAEKMYQESLDLFEQLGCRGGLLRTRLSYARFLDQQGQTKEATKMEQKARAEAEKIGAYLPNL
ncbi:serine/threonine-protein kinase PknK [Chloroflexota bacterium]